jgi:predicted alpha/beta hydrolase
MDFELEATDGYRLAAVRYETSGAPRARVVVASATGVPQRYYRRFSEHLAAAGLEVVTFDYRGIAGSKRAPLRGFDASFLTWGERDLEGVVNWSLGSARTLVVGHSYGGHAFGLLSRANDTLGLFTFGTGAGWHGHMPKSEWPRVWAFWNVLGPLTTRTLGYWPASRFGAGEDLPREVYRQWRRWCSSPRYFFDDPTLDMTARFAKVTAPVVGVNATDDAWAPPASARAFLEGYPVRELRTVMPEHSLGHFGYFRAGAQQTALWNDVLRWVDARLG